MIRFVGVIRILIRFFEEIKNHRNQSLDTGCASFQSIVLEMEHLIYEYPWICVRCYQLPTEYMIKCTVRLQVSNVFFFMQNTRFQQSFNLNSCVFFAARCFKVSAFSTFSIDVLCRTH